MGSPPDSHSRGCSICIFRWRGKQTVQYGILYACIKTFQGQTCTVVQFKAYMLSLWNSAVMQISCRYCTFNAYEKEAGRYEAFCGAQKEQAMKVRHVWDIAPVQTYQLNIHGQRGVIWTALNRLLIPEKILIFNQDLTSKNRAVLMKHKWESDCLMSFVCTCVCVRAHTLGLSPERFCSVPLQGDAGYHGSCTSSESLPLPLPPLPPSVLFSVLPSLFSFLSFGSPSFCSPSFSLSLQPRSNATVSRPPAIIYAAQLVPVQAPPFLAGRYMEIIETLHTSPQCYPANPPWIWGGLPYLQSSFDFFFLLHYSSIASHFKHACMHVWTVHSRHFCGGFCTVHAVPLYLSIKPRAFEIQLL